jgi:hypothetical protein
LLKLLDHGDVLFPDLIRLAGANIGSVTDVVLAGMTQGKLDLAAGQVDFEAIAPLAAKQLKRLLKSAAKQQRPGGVGWRFVEKYFYLRQQAGAWLDLAGYLRSPALEPLLHEALELSDPRLVAFAAVALVRRGMDVAKAPLLHVAACHETRALLFDSLQRLGRLDLFPARFRTWDAFAAADMVNWLMHPAELGREPDQLEKMAVFVSDKRKNQRFLYVWRFCTEGGPWYASTSGPYLRDGEPVPLHGDLTFSCFDEWAKASAADHAETALTTLAKWRKAEP